jgi:hypothetical protein
MEESDRCFLQRTSKDLHSRPDHIFSSLHPGKTQTSFLSRLVCDYIFSYFLSEQEEGDVLFELKQSTPSTDRRASSPVNSARAIGAPSVAGGFGAGGGASRPPDNGSRGWRSARPVLQTNYDNYSPNLALAFSPHTSAQRATNQEGSATLARPPNKNLFPIQRYPVNK